MTLIEITKKCIEVNISKVRFALRREAAFREGPKKNFNAEFQHCFDEDLFVIMYGIENDLYWQDEVLSTEG